MTTKKKPALEKEAQTKWGRNPIATATIMALRNAPVEELEQEEATPEE